LIASATSFNGFIFLNKVSLSEASGGVVSAVNTKKPSVNLTSYEVGFDIPF